MHLIKDVTIVLVCLELLPDQGTVIISLLTKLLQILNTLRASRVEHIDNKLIHGWLTLVQLQRGGSFNILVHIKSWSRVYQTYYLMGQMNSSEPFLQIIRPTYDVKV